MFHVKQSLLYTSKASLESLVNVKMGGQLLLKITKFYSICARECSYLEQAKDKLIRQWGIQDENQRIYINEENPHWAEFVKAVDEMANQDAVIEMEKFTLQDLIDANVEIEPKHLHKLEWMFKDFDNQDDKEEKKD